MNKSPIIHVDRASHTRTLKARTDFAAMFSVLAPESDFYKSHPEVQTVGSALIQAGAELADANANSDAADAAAALAHSIRDAKKAAFDQVYGVATATVERHAITPEDVKSLGYDERSRMKHPLMGPLSVTAVSNSLKGLLQIDVARPPGVVACIVEISADPVTPGSWKRLPGIGASRSVNGYPPGTYWVRAACAKGEEESDWSTPVAVIVK